MWLAIALVSGFLLLFCCYLAQRCRRRLQPLRLGNGSKLARNRHLPVLLRLNRPNFALNPHKTLGKSMEHPSLRRVHVAPQSAWDARIFKTKACWDPPRNLPKTIQKPPETS